MTTISPKLLFVDVGLVAYKRGISVNELFVKDLNDLFRGALTEQIVGQTFLARNLEKIEPLFFWFRNKPGSTAEVDYVIQHNINLIPVEVKSGKSGTLKSLHQFMISTSHDMAIRLYSGLLAKEKITRDNKTYSLFSIPLYLQWRINDLLEST